MERRGVTRACPTVSEAGEEVVVAKEPSLLMKVAVTLWPPTLSVDAVAEALPLFKGTGARLVPSTEKATVPVGVPSVEVTLALSETSCPKLGVAGEKASTVTVTGNGALSPVCTISSVGGEASAAFDALPVKVVVFEKLVAEVGVNCEVNWQTPPATTLMVAD
jgi:hypothetical protein